MEENRNIKVSVIVPIYNAEKYLRVCLDSILRQSLPEIEIIAIDDGSKDGSGKILGEYAENYPQIIHPIYQQNRGQSAARNQGLKIAAGEFIAFVDSDDCIGEKFLEKLYCCAVENDSDMVMCNYTKMSDQGEILQEYQTNYCEKGMRIPSYLCCNRLVRRSLFTEYGLYFREGVICEDIPLILKLESVAKNIKTISEAEYFYRTNPQSTTVTFKNRKLEMHQLPFDELCSSIEFCMQKEHQMELEKLEFLICRILTSLLFDTGRGCEKNVKKGMCQESEKIIYKYFPKCYKNPYIKLGYFQNLPSVQKIGPWMFAWAIRLHLLNVLTAIVK